MYRTLVADDDFLVRSYLKTLDSWEKAGYEIVDDAEDGEEAYGFLQKEKIDVLVTDLTMPVMDGIELIRKIREENRDIYIIVLSCHDDFEYVKEAMRLGADEYVLKNSLDEATTALDATVEAKILDLLLELREKTGISIVFISHDLGAVARIADRVAVMYAGKIIEIGTAEEVYYDPRHPYTWGLLSSLPVFAGEKGELNPIPGMPPSLLNPPPGDAFAVRNPQALAIDYEQTPPMFKVSDTHYAATWDSNPNNASYIL